MKPRSTAYGKPVREPGSEYGEQPRGCGVRPDKLNARVAEAELAPHQVQDFADVMSELVEATVGRDLKIKIQIELGGNEPVSEEVVARVNRVLEKVSEDLRLT